MPEILRRAESIRLEHKFSVAHGCWTSRVRQVGKRGNHAPAVPRENRTARGNGEAGYETVDRQVEVGKQAWKVGEENLEGKRRRDVGENLGNSQVSLIVRGFFHGRSQLTLPEKRVVSNLLLPLPTRRCIRS